jgi:zinc protease
MMPYLRYSPLDIAMVGDIDVEEAVALIGKYFGALPKRSGIPDAEGPDRVARFPSGKRFDVPLPTRIDNSLLVVAFPTDDLWNISRTRRMSVLAEIISEQLRVTVREELGAAYSPYAIHRPSRAFPGYGALMVFVELAPAETGRVEAAILEIIDRLVTEGVSEDQLRRAVDPTLTGIRDMRLDNRYWTDTVLAGAGRHPEQLTWSQTITADYTAITPADIDALAARYLRPEQMARIIFRPENSAPAAKP